MPLLHAVVWLDHRNAQIIQFDAEQVEARKLEAVSHDTRQHGSEVRTEHEFFGEVCDALAPAPRKDVGQMADAIALPGAHRRRSGAR